MIGIDFLEKDFIKIDSIFQTWKYLNHPLSFSIQDTPISIKEFIDIVEEIVSIITIYREEYEKKGKLCKENRYKYYDMSDQAQYYLDELHLILRQLNNEYRYYAQLMQTRLV